MVDCDICGKPAEAKAFVEGALLSVCHRCSRLGRQINPAQAPRNTAVTPLKEIRFVEGYGNILRKTRETRGLSTEELARKLFIQENTVKQLENQVHVCDEATASKIEQELGITILLEETLEPSQAERTTAINEPASRQDGGLTLADVVQIKRKEAGK